MFGYHPLSSNPELLLRFFYIHHFDELSNVYATETSSWWVQEAYDGSH